MPRKQEYARIRADPVRYRKFLDQRNENNKKQRLIEPERFRNYVRKWRADPANYRQERDRQNTRQREQRRLHPGKYRAQAHGITLAEWNALFLLQGQRCGACHSLEAKGVRGWHTDHDHKTGKVRGILCPSCNMALGMVQDDPDRLRMLAKYLEERL